MCLDAVLSHMRWADREDLACLLMLAPRKCNPSHCRNLTWILLSRLVSSLPPHNSILGCDLIFRAAIRGRRQQNVNRSIFLSELNLPSKCCSVSACSCSPSCAGACVHRFSGIRCIMCVHLFPVSCSCKACNSESMEYNSSWETYGRSAGQEFPHSVEPEKCTGWFEIIVGVSMTYNFQIGNKKIKLLMEY
jgi:hypothetical protein